MIYCSAQRFFKLRDVPWHYALKIHAHVAGDPFAYAALHALHNKAARKFSRRLKRRSAHEQRGKAGGKKIARAVIGRFEPVIIALRALAGRSIQRGVTYLPALRADTRENYLPAQSFESFSSSSFTNSASCVSRHSVPVSRQASVTFGVIIAAFPQSPRKAAAISSPIPG